jgi:PAS domain S-box-containing protein
MKRLFQSLYGTSDGAFVIDGRHRIIFWNKAAETLLGYAAEEVVGLQCYEILGGRDGQGLTLCQRYCKLAMQAKRGEVMPNQDVYAQRRNGERCWLNVTTFVYQMRDKGIGPVIVHLFRDASEKMSNQHFVEQVLSASERLQQGNGQVISLSTPTDPQANGLTARESQVLELLTHGLGTNEMAGQLTISPSTVRNHVQNVLSKLGVHSRLEAIAYAYQHGLVETKEL